MDGLGGPSYQAILRDILISSRHPRRAALRAGRGRKCDVSPGPSKPEGAPACGSARKRVGSSLTLRVSIVPARRSISPAAGSRSFLQTALTPALSRRARGSDATSCRPPPCVHGAHTLPQGEGSKRNETLRRYFKCVHLLSRCRLPGLGTQHSVISVRFLQNLVTGYPNNPD